MATKEELTEELIREAAQAMADEMSKRYNVPRFNIDDVGDPLDVTPQRWALMCRNRAIVKRMAMRDIEDTERKEAEQAAEAAREAREEAGEEPPNPPELLRMGFREQDALREGGQGQSEEGQGEPPGDAREQEQPPSQGRDEKTSRKGGGGRVAEWLHAGKFGSR